MTSNTSLYGNPRQKQSQSNNAQPSSSSLAFTTHLSSLISQHPSSSSSTSQGRSRPSKTPKSDIFSKPNKGAQKRAAADLLEDDTTAAGQKHQSQKDIGGVDEATLHRSKRRMEEKARVYEDLKRGDHLRDGSDDESDGGDGNGRDAYMRKLRRREDEGLVDFDRKWAEDEAKRELQEGQQQEEAGAGEDEEGDDDDNASIISYEDDLGRTRHGTRAQAARYHAETTAEANAEHARSERWRPQRPTNLIHGATVQTHAFNPDANITAQMDYLASRRDKSPSPPPETHYDPEGEVRNRGTGFYAFSRNEGVRRRQMEELAEVREETVKEREAKKEKKAVRERVKDERRKKIEELKVKRRAEVFLDGLRGDLGVADA